MGSADNIYRPFDTQSSLRRCGCGQSVDGAAHRCRISDPETRSNDFVEAAAVRALFPNDTTRRRFLAAVGKTAAMAAIHSVLPIASLQAMAAETPAALETKNLKIGFIPITCATPLIMADPMGLYAEQGLNVSLIKTAGWALVRDQMLNGELDASHFLSPMPLAISMGMGSSPQPMRVATIQNVNGQAITLALKHKRSWTARATHRRGEAVIFWEPGPDEFV